MADLINKSWLVYVLQCGDGSLYCGITNDLTKRLARHNAGTGAKYTRAHRPVILLTYWLCGSKSEALRQELAFKRLTRAKKFEMVKDKLGLL